MGDQHIASLNREAIELCVEIRKMQKTIRELQQVKERVASTSEGESRDVTERVEENEVSCLVYFKRTNF